jgi:hypothetical protein
MEDLFRKEIYRAVNRLVYGVEESKIVEELVEDGVDRTIAYLLVIAAKEYLRKETKELA